MRKRVLVVDDDIKLTELVTLYLVNAGYDVQGFTDGRAGLEHFLEHSADLVVLDLMLPAMDGLAVCRRIREVSTVPIIMLTARTTEADRVRGLDLGADDYVPKPFSPRELMARVRAVLRRTSDQVLPKILSFDGIRIDSERRRVDLGSSQAELTALQFDLLTTLASAPGRVFSRSELIERVLGPDFEGSDRTIDAHIKNLRRRLRDASPPGRDASAHIETSMHVGYRFVGTSSTPR